MLSAMGGARMKDSLPYMLATLRLSLPFALRPMPECLTILKPTNTSNGSRWIPSAVLLDMLVHENDNGDEEMWFIAAVHRPDRDPNLELVFDLRSLLRLWGLPMAPPTEECIGSKCPNDDHEECDEKELQHETLLGYVGCISGKVPPKHEVDQKMVSLAELLCPNPTRDNSRCRPSNYSFAPSMLIEAQTALRNRACWLLDANPSETSDIIAALIDLHNCPSKFSTKHMTTLRNFIGWRLSARGESSSQWKSEGVVFLIPDENTGRPFAYIHPIFLQTWRSELMARQSLGDKYHIQTSFELPVLSWDLLEYLLSGKVQYPTGDIGGWVSVEELERVGLCALPLFNKDDIVCRGGMAATAATSLRGWFCSKMRELVMDKRVKKVVVRSVDPIPPGFQYEIVHNKQTGKITHVRGHKSDQYLSRTASPLLQLASPCSQTVESFRDLLSLSPNWSHLLAKGKIPTDRPCFAQICPSGRVVLLPGTHLSKKVPQKLRIGIVEVRRTIDTRNVDDNNVCCKTPGTFLNVNDALSAIMGRHTPQITTGRC